MKKIPPLAVWAIAATIVGIIVISCGKDKDDNREVSVSNIAFSECLYRYDAEGWNSPDSVAFSYKDGTLHVAHNNLSVNCGYKQVDVNVKLFGDTIAISEWGHPENANCVCDINNSFDINNLPHGVYHVIVNNWYKDVCGRVPYHTTITL